MSLDNLSNYLDFIYISTENEALFKWKPPQSLKSFILDMNIVRENQTKDVFFHMDKGNRKIAYIRKKKLIFAIGSDNAVQFQILEAIIEQAITQFLDMYDVEIILSYGNVGPHLFKEFKDEMDKIVNNFQSLNLIKKIDIQCRVCGTILPLFIKRSFVDHADSYPVSIVYNHKGHAILCFIDKNYGVRGVELVAVTG